MQQIDRKYPSLHQLDTYKMHWNLS